MLAFLHTFQPQPVAFSVGALAVHWYGLFLLAGILAGYWLLGPLASRGRLPLEVVRSMYVNALIGGFVGARAYHVVTDWGFYGSNLDQIIAVWNGGLAIHGAIIGAALVVVYYARKQRLNFWKLADLFALPAILGQAIGRWGNYFNQELFGRPTDASWGIPINPSNRPVGYQQYEYFHPAFLYESLINFAIFAFLL
ncbi:MAG: prolipoprotein diacylglyceryl transferase, partial [Parcubacteria group bacterium]|nr:prolipoprotein diacylglyceryl transferase [Parcubacteria group bacterium]